MDEFEFFTQEDRQDIAYGACLGGSALVGAAVGGMTATVPGIVLFAAAGLAYGLVACKRLSPTIERKIFGANERLSEHELASVLKLIRDQTGVQTKSEAMFLFSQVRTAVRAGAVGPRSSSASCLPPRIAATRLLAQRLGRA